jgi:hypothetical protein
MNVLLSRWQFGITITCLGKYRPRSLVTRATGAV